MKVRVGVKLYPQALRRMLLDLRQPQALDVALLHRPRAGEAEEQRNWGAGEWRSKDVPGRISETTGKGRGN